MAPGSCSGVAAPACASSRPEGKIWTCSCVLPCVCLRKRACARCSLTGVPVAASRCHCLWRGSLLPSHSSLSLLLRCSLLTTPHPHLTVSAAKSPHSPPDPTPPYLNATSPPSTSSFCVLFSPAVTLGTHPSSPRSLCPHYLHIQPKHITTTITCVRIPPPAPFLQDIFREQGHLCSSQQEVHGPDGSVCDCVADHTVATYL